MLATFNGTWDWTAIGTLVLAAVTLAAVIVAAVSLRQTRREIALSRTEVEEAHRPVLVPFQKSAEGVTFRGGLIGAGGGPEVSENPVDRQDLPPYSAAFLPVENVGMGPALNIRGQFTGPRGSGTVRFPTEAVAVGARGVVAFENWDGESLSYTGDDSSVSAIIDYDDVAGRTHRTSIVFDVSHNAYRSSFGTVGEL